MNPPPGGRVALTFDDGPNGEYTLQILDILNEYHKKAAFFFPAKNIERMPEIALKARDYGHAIGSHTYDHPHLNTLTPEQVLWQVEKSEEVFKSVLGIKPRYFRPPYGEYNSCLEYIIRERGYRLILWDTACCPMDWDNPPAERIIDIVINGVNNGSVILLHDGRNVKIGEPRQNTVEALRGLMPLFFERGFEVVPIGQLCAKKRR